MDQAVIAGDVRVTGYVLDAQTTTMHSVHSATAVRSKNLETCREASLREAEGILREAEDILREAEDILREVEDILREAAINW